MTDNEDQARRKDDARPNEQLQWGKRDARIIELEARAEAPPAGLTEREQYIWMMGRNAGRAAHPADAGAVAVEGSRPYAWLVKASKCGLPEVESAARTMKDYYEGAESAPQATPLEATSELEAMLIQRRIAITPEYEGGFLAEQFGDDETASAKGYGATPSEAIAAMQPVEGATSEQMGGAQVAKPEQSASNYGDNWHSLTCDGTCRPPCAEVRPTADAGCLSPLQRYVWAGTPVEPLKHLTAHEGPFYACADVRDFIAKSHAAEGEATSERKPLTDAAVDHTRTLVRFILENADKFEWSLQGLGMLRLHAAERAGNRKEMDIWNAGAKAMAETAPSSDTIERFSIYEDHGRANMMGDDEGEYVLYSHHVEALASRAPVAPADAVSDARDWTSVADRLPDVGDLVMVYSPPTKYDHPGEVNIGFDCMDPDADEPSWLNHNEHYEHFCCVAKPEGSIGPSAEAPYTHWMPLPAAPTATPKEPAK